MVLTFTSRPRYSNGRSPQNPLSTPLPSQIWRPTSYQNNKNLSISSNDAKNFPIQSWEDERTKLVHPESRVLSLGTPLTSFGFTLYDLKDSLAKMSKMLTLLRFLGIYKPPGASWGWDYATSVFSRISTETHKFKKDDLGEWLSKRRNQIKKNKKSRILKLRLQSIFMEWYMNRILIGIPPGNKDMGIWDSWISLSLHKATIYFEQTFRWSCILYTVISIATSWILSNKNEDVGDDDDNNIGFLDNEIQHDRFEPRNNKRKQRRRSCFEYALLKSFLKPVKVICVFFIVLMFAHWKLQSSILVRDIQSGRKLQSSFPNTTATTTDPRSLSLLPMVGVRRITEGRGRIEYINPTRDDVLIGTRFNSLYLRIVNRFLDYHTGNKPWRKRIREASACTQRGLFFSTSDIVPRAVIDSILNEMKGKLLLQTPETGNFTSMTSGDSRIFTRRALILEHSLLLSELDRSISFMISEMRFESSLRATLLARFSVGLLEGIRERIFGESEQTRTYLFTDDTGNQRNLSSTTSSPFKQVRLLTPVRRSVATLKRKQIKLLKERKKKSRAKPKLDLFNKKVDSPRKVQGRNTSRANAQRVLELNRKKRQR
jgi:hypothetical protein